MGEWRRRTKWMYINLSHVRVHVCLSERADGVLVEMKAHLHIYYRRPLFYYAIHFISSFFSSDFFFLLRRHRLRRRFSFIVFFLPHKTDYKSWRIEFEREVLKCSTSVVVVSTVVTTTFPVRLWSSIHHFIIVVWRCRCHRCRHFDVLLLRYQCEESKT